MPSHLRRTAGSPVRRAVALALAVALVGGAGVVAATVLGPVPAPPPATAPARRLLPRRRRRPGPGDQSLAVTATAAAPVVVRAANPGGAVFTPGSAMVVKKSAYVVVSGIAFRSGASTMLELDSSNNVRVTHTSFDRGSAGEGSSKWLYVGGAGSHHNRIDHNRFARIGPRVENEKEAVRRSQGVVNLRHGDHNSLYGNIVLGEKRPGTGGIRIYGVDNRVFNNYVAGTTGTGFDSALSVDGGDAEPGGSPDKHHRVDDATVVFNTLVDNATGIVTGENYPKAPTNLALENNLLADSGDVRQVRPAAGGSTANNTVGTKAAVGLVPSGETWKLAGGSGQIDKAVGADEHVS